MSRKIKHFGKYRASVVDNVDPEQMARIRVEVPDVLGTTPSEWAMPVFRWQESSRGHT
jgi:type VI secretion system (T6SS) baseplate-like injector VgrG